jgi:hypothetical protein
MWLPVILHGSEHCLIFYFCGESISGRITAVPQAQGWSWNVEAAAIELLISFYFFRFCSLPKLMKLTGLIW